MTIKSDAIKLDITSTEWVHIWYVVKDHIAFTKMTGSEYTDKIEGLENVLAKVEKIIMEEHNAK